MMLKIITLFLIGMGVLAMFGKLKLPGQTRLSAARCPSCRRYRRWVKTCESVNLLTAGGSAPLQDWNAHNLILDLFKAMMCETLAVIPD